AMHATDIIVNGNIPSDRVSVAEISAYQHTNKRALLILIQVVSKLILKEISKFETPHEIWNYLKATYFIDSPISFIYELHNLTILTSSLTPSMNLSEFVKQFETQWNRLYNLTSTGAPRRAAFHNFMNFDETKRDFLLTALVKFYPNLVDNLTNKPNLKYVDFKHHLLALSINQNFHVGVSSYDIFMMSSSHDLGLMSPATCF
ncbi:hypothetical protein L211DRAFT_785304, partial [Terfezia boudieri ATCC MYA-4762]